MDMRGKRLGLLISMVGMGTLLLTGFGGCAKTKATKSAWSDKPLAGNVRFTIRAQEAKQVFLVGSFNGWSKDASPMKIVDGTAVWSIDLPLQEGEYPFMYLIDGSQWVTPPSADDFVTDEFGHTNGIVIVR